MNAQRATCIHKSGTSIKNSKPGDTVLCAYHVGPRIYNSYKFLVGLIMSISHTQSTQKKKYELKLQNWNVGLRLNKHKYMYN